MRSTTPFVVALTVALATITGGAFAQKDFSTASSWIWYPERPAVEGAGQTRYLRRVVQLDAAPAKASLRVMADDGVTFTVNGEAPPKPVESGRSGPLYDLTDRLHAGENVLAFAVLNSGGPGGLIVAGTIRHRDGKEERIASDPTFRAYREAPPGWNRPGFDDSKWPAASSVGSAYTQPWYGHPAFDMSPFITTAEAEKHARWQDQLISLPPGLGAERATTARLEYVNGQASLTLNGTPGPALIYRGTVDPLTTQGRRQIALFRDAGVHTYTGYWPLAQCWTAPGHFDFSQLDSFVRGYLSVDPQAKVILILHLVAPTWWLDMHPQEMVGYAAGPDFNSMDECGRVRTASYASTVWRREMTEVWQRCIDHLEHQPWGKRVIGYQPGYGIYTEWHYFGSWSNQMPDTGPAMTAHFRDWLRQRYATDERLRAAWGDPGASLAAAAVPGVAPRIAGDALGLRDPAIRRSVMDYYLCQQELTGDLIEGFCQTAKQTTAGRALCGAFCGYFHGVHPQTQGGHLFLERLLHSPAIDYFAAPYDYTYRLMGQDGRLRCLPQVFPLAGKMHMVEADTRTHMHPVDEFGRVPDVASSLAAIRREVSTALTSPSALWWCDFGPDGNGGWYDHPQLIGEIKSLVKMSAARLQTPRKPVAQVAVVCDLESMYLLPDAEAMHTHLELLSSLTTELYHTGTPFDTILLSQLKDGIPERYRTLIFLDTVQVSPEMRRRLPEMLKGRSVLWMWAPGISDGQRLSVDLTRDLTGFKVALRGSGLQVAGLRAVGNDPLTADLPRTSSATLRPARTEPVRAALDPKNWFNPRDDDSMKKEYTAYDWGVAEGALRWHFATSVGWSDIHLRAEFPVSDGLAWTVHGEGAASAASLRVAIKDANGDEFVTPRMALTPAPKRAAFPFAAFEKPEWRATQQAVHPQLPLAGMKFVLDALAGGEGTFVLSGLEAAWGEVATTALRGYDNPGGAHPCLVVDDPGATALGGDAQTRQTILASRGAAPNRHVLCTLPYVPREFLGALMREAGVVRYVDSPDVVVRADSSLVALHTAKAGPVVLHLPTPSEVRDAVTDQLLGTGAEIRLDLSGPSTTLLRLGPAR